MSCIYEITLDPHAGSIISEVAMSACYLARTQDCRVQFKFNGIQLIAYKDSRWENLCDEYDTRLRNGGK